jgi:hypothetical protein
MHHVSDLLLVLKESGSGVCVHVYVSMDYFKDNCSIKVIKYFRIKKYDIIILTM